MDVYDATAMMFPACSSRLLLPFTYGVDAAALEMAVLLAKHRHATLVPVAIIQTSLFAKGARLEHIQQAKDFVVLLQSKATKHDILVEPHEIFTRDTTACLGDIVRQFEGSGIILFVRDGDGVLLSAGEVKHVLAHVDGPHHIIRLPRGSHRALPNPLKRLSQTILAHRKAVLRQA